MLPDPMNDRRRAYGVLTKHRFWAYRGCAPDMDEPAVCQGNTDVPAAVFFTPEGEPQKWRTARENAAKKVCATCPIVAACAAYALGTVDGGPHERDDLWGGLTAHERHQITASRRAWLTWTPDLAVAEDRAELAQTDQRDTLLVALAGHRSPEDVAKAAGMDVRTANWQRARLVSLLDLDPNSATRMQLLRTARANGLLSADVWLVPDGPYPLAAIPHRQCRVHPVPQALTLPGMRDTTPYSAATAGAEGGTGRGDKPAAKATARTPRPRQTRPAAAQHCATATTGRDRAGRARLRLITAPAHEQLLLPPFTAPDPAPRRRPRLELAS